MAATFEKYKTSPTFRMMFTCPEIVPVGIVGSLIATLIFKKKSEPIIVNA